MRICGVDPGGSGALALLTRGGLDLQVADMPVFRVARGKGTKVEIDVFGLSDLLQDWAPDACFFERVGGMEGDAPSAAFNFGRAAGAAESLMKLTGARFQFVTPPQWKKGMGLVRKAKDDSRALATSLWPRRAADFRLKKNDGRAEAALIAEFGRRKYLEEDKGVFG